MQKEWVGIQAGKQAAPDGRRRNWVDVLTVRVQGHKAGGMLKGKEVKSRKKKILNRRGSENKNYNFVPSARTLMPTVENKRRDESKGERRPKC